MLWHISSHVYVKVYSVLLSLPSQTNAQIIPKRNEVTFYNTVLNVIWIVFPSISPTEKIVLDIPKGATVPRCKEYWNVS